LNIRQVLTHAYVHALAKLATVRQKESNSQA